MVAHDPGGQAPPATPLILRLAAPYLAVAVFWGIFANAWLTLLAYHAQVAWWMRGAHPSFARPRPARALLVIPFFALAGPALAFLLRRIARVDTSAWLADHDLAGPRLLAMVAYFGLVHPVLEQVHWGPLRERTPHAHAAFAGYHVLVLWTLLPPAWLAVCFGALWLASWVWMRMTRATGSLVPAIAAQVLADLGIVLVASLRFAP